MFLWWRGSAKCQCGRRQLFCVPAGPDASVRRQKWIPNCTDPGKSLYQILTNSNVLRKRWQSNSTMSLASLLYILLFVFNWRMNAKCWISVQAPSGSAIAWHGCQTRSHFASLPARHFYHFMLEIIYFFKSWNNLRLKQWLPIWCVIDAHGCRTLFTYWQSVTEKHSFRYQ